MFGDDFSLKRHLRDLERHYIEEALTQKKTLTAVAKLLGVSRTTLIDKMKALQIKRNKVRIIDENKGN